jgi:hypothetical protein
MLAIGGAILVVLVATGRSLGEAVPVAAVLACPLMMIGMLFIMLRGNTTQERRDTQDYTARDGHGPALEDEPATPGTSGLPDPSRRP